MKWTITKTIKVRCFGYEMTECVGVTTMKRVKKRVKDSVSVEENFERFRYNWRMDKE